MVVNGQLVKGDDARQIDGAEFQEARARVASQVRRTSLDAMAVLLLRKLGALRSSEIVQHFLADSSCGWLSQLYEVKEAIGM